jgi:hypothetical protein
MLTKIIIAMTFLAVVFALAAGIYAIGEWMNGEVDDE